MCQFNYLSIFMFLIAEINRLKALLPLSMEQFEVELSLMHVFAIQCGFIGFLCIRKNVCSWWFFASGSKFLRSCDNQPRLINNFVAFVGCEHFYRIVLIRFGIFYHRKPFNWIYIVVFVQPQQFPKAIDRNNKLSTCWFIEAKLLCGYVYVCFVAWLFEDDCYLRGSFLMFYLLDKHFECPLEFTSF